MIFIKISCKNWRKLILWAYNITICMDFDKIKKSFSDAIDLTLEKAKNLGNKTLEFAGDTLSQTSLFVQNEDDYLEKLKKKRLVVIAFDENSQIEKDLMLNLAVWQSKAFVDIATLKYLNREKSEKIIQDFGYVLPLEMRIFFQGEEVARFYDFAEIEAWWNADKRDYFEKKSEENISENNENISENIISETKKEPSSEDPLAF